MRKYTEKEVLGKLQSITGVSVGDKEIRVQAEGVGIKTWGMVDFLVNKHGYRVSKTV